MAGTYPTSQAASRWASRWNPLSVELCLRPLFGLAWGCAVARQSPSRLMSIMRASLSGLTISHLCLSALPRATKEVPTTAQTALRRVSVAGNSEQCRTTSMRAVIGCPSCVSSTEMRKITFWHIVKVCRFLTPGFALVNGKIPSKIRPHLKDKFPAANL